MKNIRCILGFHKYKYLGISEYSYSSGFMEITETREKVYWCELCGKLKAPWWWDKSNRDLFPYRRSVGWDKWKRDVRIPKLNNK